MLHISWGKQAPLCLLPSTRRLQQLNLVARNPEPTWRQWTRDKAFSPLLVVPTAFCLSALNGGGGGEGRVSSQLWRGSHSLHSLGSPLTRSDPLRHTGKKPTTLSRHNTQCLGTAETPKLRRVKPQLSRSSERTTPFTRTAKQARL